jgi:hypothetical protein
MSDNRSLIFVSHRLGSSGGVMCEFAEDKLRILELSGGAVYAITALDSIPIERKNITYFRVPSISFYELREQMQMLRERKQPIPFQAFLMFPFACTLGLFVDFLLKKKFRSSFGGFWGWGVTSIPLAVLLKYSHKVQKIFATGGASAGLVGACTRKLTRLDFFYEIPDPIVSVTMEYSPQRLRRIKGLESFLIANSTKTTFVTKYAAEKAAKRCPNLIGKINFAYPGSWNFNIHQSAVNKNSINMIHLGSLYEGRNLNTLISAISYLVDNPKYKNLNFRITNIGGMGGQIYSGLSRKIQFEVLPEMDRESALNHASKASILLLIQHRDQRSKETIPYKIYDYLNLQIPVFALIDNEEIKDLLGDSAAFTAQVGEVEEARMALSACIDSVLTGKSQIYKTVDIKSQFDKLV